MAWRDSQTWTNQKGLSVIWFDKPPLTVKEIFTSFFTHADFAVLICVGCQTVQRATPAEAERHAQTCDKTTEES